MTPFEVVRQKYRMLRDSLNERSRRLWAAAEARAIGHGGASVVVRATGISRSTILRGMKELRRRRRPLGEDRIRRPGGGRKRATAIDPGLSAALERLIEPVSRGDPESPLRWTCKSTRLLAQELVGQGHTASDWLVRQLLYDLGYSLQANRKTKEGSRHPDRDAPREENEHLRTGLSLLDQRHAGPKPPHRTAAHELVQSSQGQPLKDGGGSDPVEEGEAFHASSVSSVERPVSN